MSAVVPLRENVLPAWRRLQQVLDDNEYRVPCTVAPEAWSGDSYDPELTPAAEEACRTCPALSACAAYADVARERGAVWGGTYRGKARPTTARTSA